MSPVYIKTVCKVSSFGRDAGQVAYCRWFDFCPLHRSNFLEIPIQHLITHRVSPPRSIHECQHWKTRKPLGKQCSLLFHAREIETRRQSRYVFCFLFNLPLAFSGMYLLAIVNSFNCLENIAELWPEARIFMPARTHHFYIEAITITTWNKGAKRRILPLPYPVDNSCIKTD